MQSEGKLPSFGQSCQRCVKQNIARSERMCQSGRFAPLGQSNWRSRWEPMNRRTMSWAAAAAALLVFVTARTGKTSDISTAASQAVALDAAAATVSERVLWSFGASGDGTFPFAPLIADRWGNLYSTTSNGGASNVGTVFELSPPLRQQTQWRESVLWSFGANGAGGYGSEAGLIVDQWRNLYGTTEVGGANGSSAGTVFELSPPPGQQTQWRESVLWSFGASGDDGRLPFAGLIADQWGNLYGATVNGGANGSNVGTVFKSAAWPTDAMARRRCCGVSAQVVMMVGFLLPA